MDVRCDKCQARYRIDDARVGPNGLSMKCGKCANIFKVTKDQAAASAPPAPAPAGPPAAKPAPAAKPLPPEGATMMFAAPSAKPAPAAAPAPKGGPAEGAGATMMFVAPVAKQAPKPAEDSGSTMVFGSAPVAAPKAPPAKAAPKPVPEGAGATMVFGAAPGPAKPPAPAAPKPPPAAAPVAAAPAPTPAPEAASEHSDDDAIPTKHSESAVPIALAAAKAKAPAAEEPSDEPQLAKPGEAVGDDNIDVSATTGESPEVPGPAPKSGPPKALIIGVAAAAGVAVLALGGVLIAKKMGPKPPPEAAVQALEQARSLAEKDSLALFAQALETAKAALAAAPKSNFGEAHAAVVQIDVAWAEALVDQAQLGVEKAQKEGGDVAAAEAKVEAAQKESKAKLKEAVDAATAGAKKDPKSPDLSVALADYYRAARSSSNLGKELKRAASLKADEGRLALLEGQKLLAEDDGAEKALPKIKAAAAASPQSARLQYLLAKALLANKNEGEARKALLAALKLSPTHERAKLALALLPVPEGGDKPAVEPKAPEKAAEKAPEKPADKAPEKPAEKPADKAPAPGGK